MSFVGGPETIQYGGLEGEVEIDLETSQGYLIKFIQPVVINKAEDW